MRKPFVAGNWKMNTNRAGAVELAKGIARTSVAGVDVAVAPPFVYLDAVGQAMAGSPVLLGAQDCYCEKNGAFTGEISIDMLKDVGVKFCLAGHSERRHVICESADLIAKKARAIYSAGLILVHCVGETLAQREAGETLAIVRRQIDELADSMAEPERLVVAYEPVWAIGTGKNATDGQAQEVHVFIREELAHRWGKEFATKIRIVYGGSMKAENAPGLMAQPDVDGGLIGGASLKAETFLPICQAAGKKKP